MAAIEHKSWYLAFRSVWTKPTKNQGKCQRPGTATSQCWLFGFHSVAATPSLFEYENERLVPVVPTCIAISWHSLASRKTAPQHPPPGPLQPSHIIVPTGSFSWWDTPFCSGPSIMDRVDTSFWVQVFQMPPKCRCLWFIEHSIFSLSHLPLVLFLIHPYSSACLVLPSFPPFTFYLHSLWAKWERKFHMAGPCPIFVLRCARSHLRKPSMPELHAMLRVKNGERKSQTLTWQNIISTIRFWDQWTLLILPGIGTPW